MRAKSSKINIQQRRDGIQVLVKPEAFGTLDVVEEVGPLRTQR